VVGTLRSGHSYRRGGTQCGRFEVVCATPDTILRNSRFSRFAIQTFVFSYPVDKSGGFECRDVRLEE
jgi:hypothetical protein